MVQLGQIKGIDTLAPKQSPAFVGTPTAPTPSQSETNTMRVATVGFVRAYSGGGTTGGSSTLTVADNNLGTVEIFITNILNESTLLVADDNLGTVEISCT